MKAPDLTSLTFDFRAARAVMAGVSLGVFDALAAEPGSSAAIARRCELDPRGAASLLRALGALGILAEREGRFELSPSAREVLTAEGARSRRNIILHDLWHWGLWARLEDSVRSGEPISDRRGDPFFSDSRVLTDFFPNLSRAMLQTSTLEAGLLGERLALGDSSRLLDLGGGAGNFAIELARAHPNLEATVLDLPPIAGQASAAIKEAGLEARVAVLAGDFQNDELDPTGTGFDCVLLARVLMGLDDAAALRLLKRAKAVLRPGGRVVVLEFRPDDENTPVGALLDLDMLLLTGGAVRSASELTDLLRSAGLGSVEESGLGPRCVLLEARS